MKTASEYRREARDKLAGNLGWAILVLFVYSIILGAASSFIVGTLIFWGPLTVGLALRISGCSAAANLSSTTFSAHLTAISGTILSWGFYTTFSFFSVASFRYPRHRCDV